MRKLAGAIVVAAFLLAACDGRVYNQYRHTSVAGWEKSDVLFFDVPAVAEGGLYAVDLGLRVNGTYPFTRLTLVVEQTILPRDTVVRDTVECQLIDDNGVHLQHGISYYQYTQPVRQLELAEGDSIHACVRHDMQRDILPGVCDVGLQVAKK